MIEIHKYINIPSHDMTARGYFSCSFKYYLKDWKIIHYL